MIKDKDTNIERLDLILANLKKQNKEDNDKAKASLNVKDEQIRTLKEEIERLKKLREYNERMKGKSDSEKDEEIQSLRAKIRKQQEMSSGMKHVNQTQSNYNLYSI